MCVVSTQGHRLNCIVCALVCRHPMCAGYFLCFYLIVCILATYSCHLCTQYNRKRFRLVCCMSQCERYTGIFRANYVSIVRYSLSFHARWGKMPAYDDTKPLPSCTRRPAHRPRRAEPLGSHEPTSQRPRAFAHLYDSHHCLPFQRASMDGVWSVGVVVDCGWWGIY